MQVVDASIEQFMPEICSRAAGYLLTDVDIELEHRKQLAARGEGPKPKGGKTVRTP